MSLQVYPRDRVFQNDPTAKSLLDYLTANATELELGDAILFCNFPLFREEEFLLVAQVVLVSPLHGVILISTADMSPQLSASAEDIRNQLEGTFSQVFARLVKYPRLRKGRAALACNLDAVLWIPELPENPIAQDESMIFGRQALRDRIQNSKQAEPLASDVFDELVSVLDGSKALIRPPERKTKDFGPSSKVVQILALEEEIRRFDREQRVAYMTEVNGTQRIRGIAGSGKTVVLAMKAALTAIKNPEANIAFTYYTKSLHQHVKQLITRFYRLHEDRDPDWNRIKVFHAWGGGIVEGLYSYSAKAFGTTPLTFGQAQSYNPRQPFSFACNQLIENANIKPIFDFIFADEAQDYPPEFLRLCLKLAEEEKLVIAYDILQTIFDVETPTAGSLFGTDDAGEPAITFDEDVILHKCYRNPREILICAHALGFGIYGPNIVQMLESSDHWEDLGYKVMKGPLTSGSKVEIFRPEENSPSSISSNNKINDLLKIEVFDEPASEIEFVATEIKKDIENDGVFPEDILIVCADDRNARAYFKRLGFKLDEMGIGTHNLQEDNYGLRDFQSKGKVTLSTVYKAKGNEAYIVYIHPMAHIHIGLENNIRIAVKREMSPRSFFLFVMRQMYPESWARLLESNIARRLPHYVRGSLPVIKAPFFEERDNSQVLFE
ncbi:MAG: DUF2290 domain-containing protein [Burkholderiales bacterium]